MGYIYYYNNVREHSSLDFQTPFAYLKHAQPHLDDSIRYAQPFILDNVSVALGPWSGYNVLAQHPPPALGGIERQVKSRTARLAPRRVLLPLASEAGNHRGRRFPPTGQWLRPCRKEEDHPRAERGWARRRPTPPTTVCWVGAWYRGPRMEPVLPSGCLWAEDCSFLTNRPIDKPTLCCIMYTIKVARQPLGAKEVDQQNANRNPTTLWQNRLAWTFHTIRR